MTSKFFRRVARWPREMLYVPAMNIRPLARRALTSLPVLLLAVLAFSGSAGAATNEIENVWSFEHGSVAIQAQSNGTYTGIVLTETEFGSCPHEAGEEMWTGMKEQSDGSFWGFHKWFVDTSGACTPDPNGLGPTAWRVLHAASGAPYLKVCFSHPGTSQPKIALDGTATEVTDICVESALISSISTATGGGSSGSGGVLPSKTVVLPKGCVAQSSLKLALKDPKYDALTQVVVKLNGKTVADVKGVKRIKKGITLKKLPSGNYKIGVVATTVLKQRLTGSQTYKSCTVGSGKIKLKGSRKKHHG
jgi:hypothetical protein